MVYRYALHIKSRTQMACFPHAYTCDDGVTVTTAKDGQEALETLQAGKAVDLILTDVVMPQVAYFFTLTIRHLGYQSLALSLSAHPGFAMVFYR